MTTPCFSVNLRFMLISTPHRCLEGLCPPSLPCPLVCSGAWFYLSSLVPASLSSIGSFPSISLFLQVTSISLLSSQCLTNFLKEHYHTQCIYILTTLFGSLQSDFGTCHSDAMVPAEVVGDFTIRSRRLRSLASCSAPSLPVNTVHFPPTP